MERRITSKTSLENPITSVQFIKKGIQCLLYVFECPKSHSTAFPCQIKAKCCELMTPATVVRTHRQRCDVINDLRNWLMSYCNWLMSYCNWLMSYCNWLMSYCNLLMSYCHEDICWCASGTLSAQTMWSKFNHIVITLITKGSDDEKVPGFSQLENVMENW